MTMKWNEIRPYYKTERYAEAHRRAQARYAASMKGQHNIAKKHLRAQERSIRAVIQQEG